MTTRTITAALACAATLIGIAAASAAIIDHDAVVAVIGFTFVIIGAGSAALRVVYAAITDTAMERSRLQLAEERATSEYTRYIAARAIVDADAERLCREAAGIEARAEHHLAEEREKLLVELEGQRSALKLAAYRLGFNHALRGVAEAGAPADHLATVIPISALAVGSDSTVGSGQSS
ncbi:hypothetical protein ACFYUY_01870 [Kitasatospora sp. NPDC004745]|uniref:hypothetical protein n=1 Tax=Kitasatospora sp. NPDC004745 TaxID=3364019 RepID=UPI003696E3D2